MSIASMSGYLKTSATTVNLVQIPTLSAGAIASGTATPALTNFTIPAGSWLLFGWINTIGTTTITGSNVIGTLDGSDILTLNGTNGTATSTLNFSGEKIVSNGANQLTLTITNTMSGVGTWSIPPTNTNQTKLYLLQIG
jgi:hypothetical protein